MRGLGDVELHFHLLSLPFSLPLFVKKRKKKEEEKKVFCFYLPLKAVDSSWNSFYGNGRFDLA